MWFAPVTIDGDRYIDAVYITDANLMEAIRRGADELWIIWTVSRKRIWGGGFVNTYFQIIETSANGRLEEDLGRIVASNKAIAAGGRGVFDRHIEVKMLAAEVPLHYLINFKSTNFTAAVEQGIADAPRLVPQDREIPLKAAADNLVELTFDETMQGGFCAGADRSRARPPAKAPPKARRLPCTRRCRSATSIAFSTCRSIPAASAERSTFRRSASA